MGNEEKIKKMKKILLVLVFFVLVGILLTKLPYHKRDVTVEKKTSNSPTSTQSVSNIIENFSEEDLEQYYAVYEDPYVKHVRVALNGYLNGSNEGMSVPEMVIETGKVNNAASGLSSFSKDYYQSKFIVFTINDSLAGGREMNIIFQDKPDKVFYVWVYQVASGEYDLRGFAENNKYNSEDIQQIRIDYKTFLEDEVHSM